MSEVGESTQTLDVSKAKLKIPLPMLAIVMVSLFGFIGTMYQAFALGHQTADSLEELEIVLIGDVRTGKKGLMQQVQIHSGELAKMVECAAKVDDHEQRLALVEATRYTQEDASMDRERLFEALSSLQREVVTQAAAISATQAQILKRLDRLEDR